MGKLLSKFGSNMGQGIGMSGIILSAALAGTAMTAQIDTEEMREKEVAIAEAKYGANSEKAHLEAGEEMNKDLTFASVRDYATVLAGFPLAVAFGASAANARRKEDEELAR
jgi:hypothetical protein